jgi:hypothetical protein
VITRPWRQKTLATPLLRYNSSLNSINLRFFPIVLISEKKTNEPYQPPHRDGSKVPSLPSGTQEKVGDKLHQQAVRDRQHSQFSVLADKSISWCTRGQLASGPLEWPVTWLTQPPSSEF